jgi:hypothetical protein
MELEAAVLPSYIRLNYNSRRYVLCALKLCQRHPIRVLVNKAISRINEEIQDQEVFDPSSITQVESLIKLIYPLINLNTIKEIKHFYFLP